MSCGAIEIHDDDDNDDNDDGDKREKSKLHNERAHRTISARERREGNPWPRPDH